MFNPLHGLQVLADAVREYFAPRPKPSLASRISQRILKEWEVDGMVKGPAAALLEFFGGAWDGRVEWVTPEEECITILRPQLIPATPWGDHREEPVVGFVVLETYVRTPRGMEVA